MKGKSFIALLAISVLVHNMFPHKRRRVTAWEIASSYRILYLLALDIRPLKNSFPFQI